MVCSTLEVSVVQHWGKGEVFRESEGIQSFWGILGILARIPRRDRKRERESYIFEFRKVGMLPSKGLQATELRKGFLG